WGDPVLSRRGPLGKRRRLLISRSVVKIVGRRCIARQCSEKADLVADAIIEFVDLMRNFTPINPALRSHDGALVRIELGIGVSQILDIQDYRPAITIFT